MSRSNIIQRVLKAIKKRKSPPCILTIVDKAAPEFPLPALEGLLTKLVSDGIILEHTQTIRSIPIAPVFKGTNDRESSSKLTYRIDADELNNCYSAN